MTEQEYEVHLTALIADFATNPQNYLTPDQVAAKLHPFHPANQRALLAAKNTLKIPPSRLEAALVRKAKAEQKLAEEAAHQQKVQDMLGASPQTEREFVKAFLASQGYQITFAGDFITAKHELVGVDVLLPDIQLTAADLGLTRKPLELKDRNFARALAEAVENERKLRIATTWHRISQLSVDRDPVQMEKALLRLCSRYFKQPALAAAVLKKVVWQVKRKMQGMTIPEHHAVFLYGGQDTGKTTFWHFFKSVIADLCKGPVDVPALVSEAQLDLYKYFLIDTDEMSRAERADIGKLKSIVTAQKVTRRIYYTQMVRDVPMASTIIGSTNKPVAALIKDTSGMRRFIQLDVLTRAEIEPYWHEIEQFDWLGLWQMVDHQAQDPVWPFMSAIKAQQEQMREKDRVETWLAQFEPRQLVRTPFLKGEVVRRIPASDLFKLFQRYEEWAFPGIRMQLNNWGVRMKELIDGGNAPEWEYDSPSRNRTYYSYGAADVVALPAPDAAVAAE